MQILCAHQKMFTRFPYYLIGQLNQLRAISRPTETLEVKSPSHMKDNLKTQLIYFLKFFHSASLII